MTALTREQVEEWAKMAEQATPEPWEVQAGSICADFRREPSGQMVAHWIADISVDEDVDYDDDSDVEQQSDRDAFFICAARAAVPALAANWIAQREEIERANEYVIGEQYTSDTVTNPIDALIEIATERGLQYESVASQLAAKDAEIERLTEENRILQFDLHAAVPEGKDEFAAIDAANSTLQEESARLRELLRSTEEISEQRRRDIDGLKALSVQQIAKWGLLAANQAGQLAALRKVAEAAQRLEDLSGPCLNEEERRRLGCTVTDYTRARMELRRALAEKEKPDAR